MESNSTDNPKQPNETDSENNPSQLIEDETNALFDDISSAEPTPDEGHLYIDSFEANDPADGQKKKDSPFKRLFGWMRRKEKEIEDNETKTTIDSRLSHLIKPVEPSGEEEIYEIKDASQDIQKLKPWLDEKPSLFGEQPEELPQSPDQADTFEPAGQVTTLQPTDLIGSEFFIPHEETGDQDGKEKEEGFLLPTFTTDDEWLEMDIDIEKVREALSQESHPETDESGETTSETETETYPSDISESEAIDITTLREAFLARKDEKTRTEQAEDFYEPEDWVFEDLSDEKNDDLLETLEDDEGRFYEPPPPIFSMPEEEAETNEINPDLINTLEDQWLDLDLETPVEEIPEKSSFIPSETTVSQTEIIQSTDEDLEPEIDFLDDDSLYEDVAKGIPPSHPHQEHYSLLLDMRKGFLDDMDTPVGVPVNDPDETYLEIPEGFTLPDEEDTSEKRKRKFPWIWVIIPAGLILILAVAFGIFIAISRMNIPTPQPSVMKDTAVVTENLYESTSIYPEGIMLTSGWYFELNPGILEENVWKPQSAEWLFGTELKRVIALPRTKQLEAVVTSLEPGDTISLAMSNDDILIYHVEKVEKVPRDRTDVLSGSKASLVIILYDDSPDDRWVVVCKPPDTPQ